MGIPPPNGWKGKSGIKALQMFAADIAGNAADMVFLRYQNQFDKAFPVVKDTFKSLLYLPIKTVQRPLEWTINTFGGNLEGDENKVARQNQSEEQRLDGLIDTSYHYLAAGAVGLGTLMLAEKGLSKVMGTGHVPNRVWWLVDAPVHLGAAVLLATPAMKPATSAIKGTMKNIMIGAGWSEEKAEQDSRFAVAYILPNYLTLIPTALSMNALYQAESHGILKEVRHATHSHFHHVEGKSINDMENGFAKKMLGILSKIGAIEGPVKTRSA